MTIRFPRVRGCAAAAAVLLFAGAAAAVELPQRDALRVCADANLMPFSNDRLEGFENQLAGMIGRDLGVPVVYTWWPQTIGFVRNTLGVRKCDLVVGTAAGEELMQNTNPYYRSVYALVYRVRPHFEPKGLADPALRTARVGVVERTPVATLLNRYGVSAIEPYQLDTDTRADNPARRAIEDVASGRTDAAVIWGPIAGYVAAQQKVPLAVVPLVAEARQFGLSFPITMGVRADEPDWKHWLNDFITRHQGEINRLLASYHVPLLAPDGRLITASEVAEGGPCGPQASPSSPSSGSPPAC